MYLGKRYPPPFADILSKYPLVFCSCFSETTLSKMLYKYLFIYKQIKKLTLKIQYFRKTLETLITIDVHAKDIIDSLAKENVTSVSAFSWSSQMRCLIYLSLKMVAA